MHSMTAFARGSSQGDWGSLIIEIRSINHRYLEAGFRLPDHCRHLEMPLREKMRDFVSRGKLDITVRFVQGDTATQALRLNRVLLKQLLAVRSEIVKELAEPATFDIMDVLKWPGVVVVDELDQQIINQAIMKLFEATLQQLCEARAKEGLALKQFLLQHLTDLDQYTHSIQERLPSVLINYRKKLIDRLSDIKIDHESNRLEQELVLIAQRIDVAEEVERLATHIENTRSQLQKSGATGRHLDFLMQEFHRETNTLGVKCSDTEITKITVEMKVVIEKMREQIQNIE